MPEQSNRGEKWLAAASMREWTQGRGATDPDEVHPHVGLVDDQDVRRLLSTLAEHYSPEAAARSAGDDYSPEDFPARVEQTKLWRTLLRRHATETGTKAVRSGDTQTQSYFVGDPGQRADVSGMQAIETIRDLVDRPAPILYIFGAPGSGKTNVGLLLAEVWSRVHDDGLLASNIRSWQEQDDWLPTYGALRAWLGEATEDIDGGTTRREDARPRLFVFDEASSHASGRGGQGLETGKKLGPLVYQIRKSRAGLVIIGHDGRDVHPAVRTLATVVQKPRQEVKRATLWEDVKDREGRGLIDRLTGIPETSFTYDDGEATSWSWAEVEDEDDDRLTLDQAESMAEDMVEDEQRRLAAALSAADWLDLSNSEIGQVIGLAARGEPYDRTWVSKWKRRIEDAGDLPEAVVDA